MNDTASNYPKPSQPVQPVAPNSQAPHPPQPQAPQTHAEAPKSNVTVFPSLPGQPISDEEHQILKAHRDERQKKWAELEKMAAELGGGVTGKPGEVRLKHRPSQAQRDAGRPSGLSVEQEAENSILLDDTERNIMHREKEMKDAQAAAQKAASVQEREAARFSEERNAKKPA